MPGKPTEADKWEAPHDVLDAKILYARNCRGCHGAQGEVSGAIAMDNPMYLAVVPRETLRTVIAGGIPGTGMVGFSEEHGGPLTEKQLDALVEGIIAWGKNPPSGELPPYSAPLGNSRRVQPLSPPFARVAMALRERRQGWLCHSSRLSWSRQRSILAHHRYRWTRSRMPRFSEPRLRSAHVGRRDFRCRRVARVPEKK